MTQQPLVKRIVVTAKPDAAFDRFTKDIATWWPVQSHSVSAGQGTTPKAVHMELRLGGQIVETLQDDSTSIWGTITEWQPGVSLAFTWHPGADASLATHVHLAFKANDTGTEVTLTHTGWEVLADRAEAVRGNYDGGWDFVFGTSFGDAK